MKKQKVILIFGPGGAGKTSTSKRIAENKNWAFISEDEYWGEIKKGHLPHELRTHEEQKIVWQRVKKDLKSFLSKGKNVVLEFIIYEDPPKPLLFYRRELSKLNVEILIRCFRPKEEAILDRRRKRGLPHDLHYFEKIAKRKENSESKNQLDVLDSKLIKQEWKIDNSNYSLEETYQKYFSDFVEDKTVEIIKNKNLTIEQKKIINKARVAEWGKGEEKDFSKDYEPETLWFFVKDPQKVVSLGGIRPIKLKYLGKVYSIGGICSTISLVKGKGYGKIMISFMRNYSFKTGKTLLGFTRKTEFFKKADLGIEKDFIKRFVYVKKDGEKVYDNSGDGIYYEGKDKVISKILKTKKPVFISVLHW